MDQVKIGNFLKELRKEQMLTQEQLAEQLNVSRRTISRWETGSNLPDLDLLIDLADLYEVDLRELLDGERKDSKMDKELEETVLKVADYSNAEKEKLNQRMHYLFVLGLLTALIYAILQYNSLADGLWGGLCLGFTTGMMIVGVIMTSKYGAELAALKNRLLRRKQQQH